MKSYSEFKRKTLRDRNVKRAYEEMGPQFEVIQMIIRRRIKRGITQKELARMVGTKQSAISRFESGDYNPTLSFLGKMADALGAEIKVSVR